MSKALLVLFLVFAGPGLGWLGFQSLRHGHWRDSVPLLEVAIDRAAGIDLPQRTTGDRHFAHAQAWLHVALGGFFSFCLMAVLTSLVLE